MTHLGQPTVVTSLSPQILYDSVLGVDAASIDTGAGGFSTAYINLMVLMYLRTTQAAVASSALLSFNGDGGANYDYCRVTTANVTVSGTNVLAQTSMNMVCLGASAQAGDFTALDFLIPNYAGTVGHKAFTVRAAQTEDTAADNQVDVRAGRWRSTAAINRINIAAGSGSLLAGSRMTVYGL